MNVSLTPELEQIVKRKVDSGMYKSLSEVVREGLRLLDNRDRAREVQLERLREAIQEGFQSGPSIPGEQVFEEITHLTGARRHQDE